MIFKETEFGDLSNKIYDQEINISGKNISSLKGRPIQINSNFIISFNILKSLKYRPKKVKGFDCRFNNLTSLQGCPEIIKGDFDCNTNNLKSLEGCPKEIKGNFDCSINKLTSLEYCPKKIKNIFYCEGNKDLKNVKEQIIQYQIEAKEYYTDEGNFLFEDIEKEFLEYKLTFLLKTKKEENKKIKKIINDIDYGLSI